MQTEKCNNRDCGKEFNVQLVGEGFPAGKESEDVVCPYCYWVVRTEVTGGLFRTSKLNIHD